MTIGLLLYTLSLLAVIAFAYFSIFWKLWPPLAVTSFNKSGWRPVFGLAASNSIGWEQAKARTMYISVVFFAECLLVLGAFRFNQSASKTIRRLTRFEKAFIFLPILILFSIMYLLPIQKLVSHYFDLELIRLGPLDLLYVIVLSFVPLLLFELYKWINRSLKIQI